MKIKEIKLVNFRNVEEGNFSLNPKFTVFIGINGSGKSTILNAVRIVSGAFFLGIPEVGSRHINEDEIRTKNEGKFLNSQTPVVVEAQGWVRKNENEENFAHSQNLITWRRQIQSGGKKTTSSSLDVEVLREFGKSKHSQMKNGDDNLDLPVIAFFGTKRLHGEARNRAVSDRKGRLIFKDGYDNWQDMKSAGYKYATWLSTYEGFLQNGWEYPGMKQLFLDTLKEANPYIREVDFIQSQLWVKIEMENYKSDFLPIKYHSDGVVTYTEMVAELTYRCITLNGYKGIDAVKKSTGVVMIDELDMHLHPTWQRHVVEDLKMAFPGIQFIATTHSPFIVQSLKSDELYNLDRLTDTDLNKLDLNEVATNVMGVESSFSEENETQEEISEKYLKLINRLKKDEKVGRQLNELEDKISDPGVRAFLKMQRLKHS